MKKNKIFTAIICGTLTLMSCKKEKVKSTVGNSEQLKSFFNTNVENNTQHFTCNASNGGVIVGAKGTKIFIYSNSLYNSSNVLVTGNVNIDLVEIYDRASMVFLNKPTMGRLPNGNMSTLISGGEYYLKITQDGQILNTLNGVKVLIPVNNTGASTSGMSLFDGENLEDGALVWNLIEDSVVVEEDTIETAFYSYAILDGSWGWTNVDRFYSDPRPKTVLKVKTPEGYDNTNCELYLTYDGEETALASLDMFTNDGYFSEHYGLIPIGLQIHLIAVTVIDGQLNYSIVPVTIVDGQVEHITSFSPISQSELAILINDLP